MLPRPPNPGKEGKVKQPFLQTQGLMVCAIRVAAPKRCYQLGLPAGTSVLLVGAEKILRPTKMKVQQSGVYWRYTACEKQAGQERECPKLLSYIVSVRNFMGGDFHLHSGMIDRKYIFCACS